MQLTRGRPFLDLLVLACAVLPLAAPPAAADPQEIEDGEPVTLEDAYPSPPGLLSLQYSTAYTTLRDSGRKEFVEQGPTFKLGAIKGVQVSLNPNYATGTASERNSGNLLSDVLVQLSPETRLFPALSLDTFYATAFGAGHKSAEYVFRAIASKELGNKEQSPRLHLNLTDYHQTQPDRDTRKEQLQLVFGGSTLLSPKGALVTDIVYGGAEQIRQHETFLEVGYSRDLPNDWTLELGIGKQVAGRADALRLFFSIETDVQLF